MRHHFLLEVKTPPGVSPSVVANVIVGALAEDRLGHVISDLPRRVDVRSITAVDAPTGKPIRGRRGKRGYQGEPGQDTSPIKLQTLEQHLVELERRANVAEQKLRELGHDEERMTLALGKIAELEEHARNASRLIDGFGTWTTNHNRRHEETR